MTTTQAPPRLNPASMPAPAHLAWADGDAREALRRYETVVRGEARRLRPLAARSGAVDEEDLAAEGRIAVLEALKRFQSWGVNESTWVRMRVRQRMLDAVRRASVWTRSDAQAMTKERRGEALSETDRARAGVAAARRMVSIDADGEERGSLGDTLPSHAVPADEVVDAHMRDASLRRAVKALTPRACQVVERVLFEGQAARDVALDLGVSESRISQILHGAIPLLRASLAEC